MGINSLTPRERREIKKSINYHLLRTKLAFALIFIGTFKNYFFLQDIKPRVPSQERRHGTITEKRPQNTAIVQPSPRNDTGSLLRYVQRVLHAGTASRQRHR